MDTVGSLTHLGEERQVERPGGGASSCSTSAGQGRPRDDGRLSVAVLRAAPRPSERVHPPGKLYGRMRHSIHSDAAIPREGSSAPAAGQEGPGPFRGWDKDVM